MLIINQKLIYLVVLSFGSFSDGWEFDLDTKLFNIKCVDGKPVLLYEKGSSINYSVIEINECPAPATVYIDVIRSLELNIPKKLKIGVNEGSFLSPPQFEGLTIEALHVTCQGWNFNHAINSDILTKLKNLKEFKLGNAQLPSLPENTMIKQLELWNGYSVGAFGGCNLLENLILVWWNVEKVNKTWLQKCLNLRILTLKQMSPDSVKKVLSGTTSVTELYIYKCHLLELTAELISNQINLRKLHVHHNRIKFIYLYKSLQNLQDVDLSYNEISECDEIVRILEKHSETLVNFTIAHNKLLDVCETDRTTIDTEIYSLANSGYLPKLKRLSLANTATTKLCLEVLAVESLEYLDLSKNKLTVLEFQRLPLSTAKHLQEINLSGTGIKDVNFTERHYKMLDGHRELKLSGLTLGLDCDCSYPWFARAIRDKRVIVDAFCGRIPLEQVPNNTLECEKYKCERCTCRRLWEDGKVTAHCDGEQNRIPQVANLARLFAPGNQIEGFSAAELPDSLMEIDLRSNHIARLDEAVVAALFNVSGSQIRLSGNPLVCDCKNVPLFEVLKKHSLTQAVDYENLTCVNGGFVKSLDLEALCAEPLDPRIWIALSFFLGIGVIFAISTAIFYKYERPVKVFLYARGCCPWWLHEEEVDADRPFDAFVSFAHSDDEFVMDNLLPELEKCGYSLCIHYRDWCPGEWIPAQISRSVEQSCRTIIVLSKSYLESSWGLLEFRLAHVRTLKEGRPRIIVLMLEDVSEEQMDDELKGYLNSNTYVKWEDKWFWDKLKYALPHRSILRDDAVVNSRQNCNEYPMT